MTPRPSLRLAFLALTALLCSCAPGGSGGGGGKALTPGVALAELVYARSRPGFEHTDSQLRTLLADGLADKRVIDQNGREGRVRLAPDGHRVAFPRQRRTNDPSSQELFIGDLDGIAAEIRLTNDSAFDDSPCWSPDGSELAFVSDRLGTGARLFAIAADGTALRTVHDDGAELADPDWSATAGLIAFTRASSLGVRELWTVRPDGSNARRLTDGGAGPGDRDPAWSPDGRNILISRALDQTRSNLVVVEVATGIATPIPIPATAVRQPRYSPAADRIFFAAADPRTGVSTLRLHCARTDGTDAFLLVPDDRYDVLGVDCHPTIRAARAGAAEWTNVRIEHAVVSNSAGRRSRGTVDDVLADDGILFGIATDKQGHLQVGGMQLTLSLGLMGMGGSGYDVIAIEITVEAGITTIDPVTWLRLTIADYVTQRHATMVLAPRTDETLGTWTYTVGGLRCVDRRGDARVSIVAEKDENTPGELLIDVVSVRVLHTPSP